MSGKPELFIKENPPLISEDVIKRAEKLSVSLISDAMEGFGVMEYTIKPMSAGKKLIGTALTVNCPAGDNFMLHKALYSAGEGYVVTVDGKGHTSSAAIGELMVTAAIALGINGVILDGVVRDLAILRELPFPIFAKGAMPNATTKNGLGEINGSISCGGITVNPGDLVIGDYDGVAVVPQGILEQVLAVAEEKAKKEEVRLQEIADGKIMPAWVEEKIKRLALK